MSRYIVQWTNQKRGGWRDVPDVEAFGNKQRAIERANSFVLFSTPPYRYRVVLRKYVDEPVHTARRKFR